MPGLGSRGDKRYIALYSLHTFLQPPGTKPVLQFYLLQPPILFLSPPSHGTGLSSPLHLFDQLVTLAQPHPSKLPQPGAVLILPHL